MGCCESKDLENHSNEHNVQPERQAMVRKATMRSAQQMPEHETPEDHILFAVEADRPSDMNPAPVRQESELTLETTGDSAWVRGSKSFSDGRSQHSADATDGDSALTHQSSLVTVVRSKIPQKANSRLSVKSLVSMTMTSDATVCLLEQRPTITCGSERTVCVGQERLSMTANSDLTICLTEQRQSLSAMSQKTVCCFRKRSSVQATDMHSDLTICIGRPSMSANSERTIFITETTPDYHETDMHSDITVCLNGRRVSLSAMSEVTVSQQRPSLSCNSDATINVRKSRMSCNSDVTICLNSQRASLSCNSDNTVNVRKFSMARGSVLTICMNSQRASLSCNSDQTVNVHQPRMREGSNLTVCLNSQRASLSCQSDCTVNVHQPRMREGSNLTVCLNSQRASLSCQSDCTVMVKKFSMSRNSCATVCILQDILRKSSDGFACYDDRLSLHRCNSINLQENKDLSDETVGIIDKILLDLSPDGYEENLRRVSHYTPGSGNTLSHHRRRKTYCPSSLQKDHLVKSSGHRQRFASSRSMSPNLAREMAMRLALSSDDKAWTLADLFTARNMFKLSPLMILLAMLLPYIHVDLHQCPLEDECFHCTFHFGEDEGVDEIAELQKDWMC